MLCEHTALALCILVAADVLDTVIKPVHAYLLADVVKMGFVTILRTGIAYFLARELKELEEDHSTSLDKVGRKVSGRHAGNGSTATQAGGKSHEGIRSGGSSACDLADTAERPKTE